MKENKKESGWEKETIGVVRRKDWPFYSSRRTKRMGWDGRLDGCCWRASWREKTRESREERTERAREDVKEERERETRQDKNRRDKKARMSGTGRRMMQPTFKVKKKGGVHCRRVLRTLRCNMYTYKKNVARECCRFFFAIEKRLLNRVSYVCVFVHASDFHFQHWIVFIFWSTFDPFHTTYRTVWHDIVMWSDLTVTKV